MKKNIRKIVVNDKIYHWCAGLNNCDGDGSNLITIWKEKKEIYRELSKWDIQIKPSLIREIIENVEQTNNTTSARD